MTRLCQSEQGVRGTAGQANVWLEARQPAGSVECAAHDEFRIQHKQRLSRESVDFQCSTVTESRVRMTGRKQLDRFERHAYEPRVVRVDGLQQVLRKMDLAMFQHGQAFAPCRLDDLDLDIRKTAVRSGVETARARFRCAAARPQV